MRSVLLFIFLFYSFLIAAQDISQDFDQEVPSEIISFHEKLESTLTAGEVDSAWIVYNEMVASIDTTDNIELQAWTWYHYGDMLSYSVQYLESNVAYENAIRLTNSLIAPNIIILIRGHNNLYYNLDELGFSDEAFSHILKAYEYLTFAPKDENKSNIIYNLARGLKSQGEFALASQYMEQVIELDKVKKDSVALGHNHQFLAELYRLQKDISASIREYYKAIAINPSGQTGRLAMYHNGIADAFAFDSNLDSAIYHSQISVDFARKDDSKNILAFALTEKGENYLLKNDNLNAKIAFNEALLLAEAFELKKLAALIRIKKSVLLPPAERKNELLKSLNSAEHNGWGDVKEKAIKSLIESNTLQGNAEKVKYLRIHNNLLKDFVADNAGKETKRLEARMALVDREQQIQELKQQALIRESQAKTNRIIRSILIGLILIALAGLVLLYLTFKQKKALSEAKYRSQLTAKVNEIDILRDRLTTVLEEGKKSIALPTKEELNEILDTPLTEKEYEVLVDVSKGLTNKEIGEQQFISSNTVKFHLRNIFSKLDVNNRKEAIKRVLTEV